MDAVERQLEAYNARDAEAFTQCYAEGVVIESAAGAVPVVGRDALREDYAKFFAERPALRAEIVSRIRVGDWVGTRSELSSHPTRKSCTQSRSTASARMS